MTGAVLVTHNPLCLLNCHAYFNFFTISQVSHSQIVITQP